MRRLFVYVLLLIATITSFQSYAMSDDGAKTKRILSIGPGVLLGYQGILVLEAIEKNTGRPISELFDFIGGTSTGAVMTALLTRGEEGHASYTAKDVRGFYEKFAPEIFSHKSLSVADVISIEQLVGLKNFFLNLFHSGIQEIINDLNDDELDCLKTALETEDPEKFKSTLISVCASRDGTSLSDTDLLIKQLTGRFSESLSFFSAPHYFDCFAFKARLIEKLGEYTRVSHGIKPIAIFSEKFECSPGDHVVSKIKSFGGMTLEKVNPSNVIAFTADTDVSVADAAFASSAATNLFPPMEIIYEGKPHSFADGDVFGFSTLEGTIKEARKLWPDTPFEVYYLSFLDDTPGDTLYENATIHFLYPPQNWEGPRANRADPSSENFDIMQKIADSYIASDHFAAIVKRLQQ